MEFNIGTFFMGLAITIAGALMVRFYKEISDNFVHGISSYDKVRLWGLGITIFGILYAFSIINLIVIQIIKLIFPGIN